MYEAYYEVGHEANDVCSNASVEQNIFKQNSIKAAIVASGQLGAGPGPKFLLKAVLATSILRAEFSKCRRNKSR